MKQSAILEALAGLMAILGALMFVFGLFPRLNPIQWRLIFGPAYLTTSMASLVASIPVMALAWWLSQRSRVSKE